MYGIFSELMFSFLDKPLCMDSQKKLYGLAKGEKAVISCMVDSYPAPSAYRWAFNNTAETRDLTDVCNSCISAYTHKKISTKLYKCKNDVKKILPF